MNKKQTLNNHPKLSHSLTLPWQHRNTAQESIPYEWLSSTGLCYLGDGNYSITYRFSDINYRNVSDEMHVAIFEQYCNFLNSHDDTVMLQLHIVNRMLSNSNINDLFLEPHPDDDEQLRTCVKDYNNILERRMSGKNSYIQDKYLTVTTKAENEQEAERAFARIDSDCMTEFRLLKCRIERLDEIGRLYLLRNIYRQDDASAITEEKMIKSGVYGKDLIAPYSIDASHGDYLKFDDFFAKTFFVTDLPDELSDDFLTDICSVDEEIFITINIKPQDAAVAIEETRKRLKALDTEEYNSQQRQLKAKVFIPKTPRDLQHAIDSTEAFLEDLQSKNEKMFLYNTLIILRGNTLNDIDLKAKKVSAKINKAGCKLKPFSFSHENSFNSVLPLGRNDTFVKRSMTTSSIAAFSPFNVIELVQQGGLSYGKNSLSNNLLIIDRKKATLNANAFVYGGSGSGKSMGAKSEVWEVWWRTNDDILIIDPENEFRKIVELLHGQVIDLSSVSINPFEINEWYGGKDEPNPIPFKSEFIISLIDGTLNLHGEMDPISRSVIDNVIREIYAPYVASQKSVDIPTFVDFFEVIGKHSEPEAQYLHKALELYVKGSLNIFAGRTSIPLNNRLICFDTHKLGKNLSFMANAVMQDFCWNTITKNQKENSNTWLYNDEVHLYIKEPVMLAWLRENWKRGRKYGLIPTGITQEVNDCLRSDDARSLIANSEMLLLYRQKEEMLPGLAQVLNLSPQQVQKLLNAEAGTGLMKIGKDIVEFDNRISKDCALYNIMKTTIGE